MQLFSLKNKKIIIAPNTPLTQAFGEYLRDQGFHVVGFLDKHKRAKDSYHVSDIKRLTFDAVLIYNELFFHEIYAELKKEINVSSIYRVISKENDYILLGRYEILSNKLREMLTNTKIASFKMLQKSIAFFYRHFAIERKITLFVAKDSIGSNLKHLHLYYNAHEPSLCYIITDNPSECEILNQQGFNCLSYQSLRSYMYAAIAKTVITEQVIMDYFDLLDSKQKSLQLWHGIALKKLYPSRQLLYDFVLGTSNWVNDTMFKEIFQSKTFLNCGYPRNDILFRDITPQDLIFCDKKILNLIKYNFDNKIHSILYMPTYRESAKDNIPPLDFEQLNLTMKAMNTFFIVKLHPFALEKYKTTLQTIDHFSHVIFYNTQGDIYPILKYIDLLVTDYSSIAFDFLLLDRPIVYFDYDYEHYLKTRGAFLLKYADYTPGIKVKTQDALIRAIAESFDNQDMFKQQRLELKAQLFDYHDGNASQRIHERLHTKKDQYE